MKEQKDRIQLLVELEGSSMKDRVSSQDVFSNYLWK